MKHLALILIAFAAGCSSSQAGNPYPHGTPQYEQWQHEHNVRRVRRSPLFEGHDLPDTTTPPGSVPRHERD